MLMNIEIPKYLDVMLILDDKVTKSKIYKNLNKSSSYIGQALKYLEHHGLITMMNKPHDDRQLIIELTPKGKNVQKVIITLYNSMGIKVHYDNI